MKNICACGKEHKSDVKELIVGDGVIKRLPEKLKKLGCKKAFLLSDTNTYAAAGELAEKLLLESEIPYSKYIFAEKHLEPDEWAVGSAVMHFDKKCDTVVAVGSGVVGDVAKILANTAGAGYVIVATAPSMDGYASATSSMAMDGVKVTLPSRCADVIIGDTDILKNAPIEMLISGLGDMIAKYISICEWRIANIITGEYYCEQIAATVREALRSCVDNADKLLLRDGEAVEAVFRGLVLAGQAMAYAGCSRPASGIEHYFSHVWDMRALEFGSHASTHGIQCAIATLISARLYEKIKQMTPDAVCAKKYAESFDYAAYAEDLKAFLGKGADAMIALEAKEGKYSVEKHRERIEKISEKWGEIVAVINEEIPDSAWLYDLLLRIGCPTSPADIGIDTSTLPDTFKATKDIRDKYVLSRLAYDLGVIDEMAEGIES